MAEAPAREEVRPPGWTRNPRVRRLRAVRLARLLLPGAHAAALWPSAELRLSLGSVVRRPFVCVAAGEPPVDGLLSEPPVLVVEPAGEEVATYLRAEAAAAWRVGVGHAELCLPGGWVERRHQGEELYVPGWPSLRLGVAAVTGALGEGTEARYGLTGDVR